MPAQPGICWRWRDSHSEPVLDQFRGGVTAHRTASIQQLREDRFHVMRMHQALFAYLETLTKTFLTCVPEPSLEVIDTLAHGVTEWRLDSGCLRNVECHR